MGHLETISPSFQVSRQMGADKWPDLPPLFIKLPFQNRVENHATEFSRFNVNDASTSDRDLESFRPIILMIQISNKVYEAKLSRTDVGQY